MAGPFEVHAPLSTSRTSLVRGGEGGESVHDERSESIDRLIGIPSSWLYSPRPCVQMWREKLIDVVIVEDHAPYRDMLEYLLVQNNGMSCRSFGNVTEALLAMRERVPDVVLMDISLPGDDGIVGTRLIRQEWPQVPVLICTVHEDDEAIFNALRAGANGYLLKRAQLDQVVQGIHQVLEGGSPISPAIARRVIKAFQKPVAKGMDGLTERELQVLDLLAAGMRVKAIAAKLFLSESTVRTHVHHIYEKMQVNGRLEMMNRIRGDQA